MQKQRRDTELSALIKRTEKEEKQTRIWYETWCIIKRILSVLFIGVIIMFAPPQVLKRKITKK